jgi:hypothetical protein
MQLGKILSYQEFARTLISLCEDKSSGTLFFTLKSGLCARIVLSEGEIKWLAFNGFSGEKAITAMRTIDSGRLNFNPTLQIMIGKQNLPSTLNILREIKIKPKYNDKYDDLQCHMLNDNTNSSVTGANKVDIMKNNNNNNKACEIAEYGALNHTCPVVKYLNSKYAKSLSPQLSQTQIHQLIDSIKKSIIINYNNNVETT